MEVSGFSYNGIEISVVKVNSVKRTPIYTDSIDYMYDEIIIDVNGIVHLTGNEEIPEVNFVIFGKKRETNKAYEYLCYALLQPRQRLVFKDLCDVASDCNDGPMPLSLRVCTDGKGKNKHLVRYVVKAWLVNCMAGIA